MGLFEALEAGGLVGANKPKHSIIILFDPARSVIYHGAGGVIGDDRIALGE